MSANSTKSPLNLAIFFDQKLHSGGGYQQALNAALLARKLPKYLVNISFYTNISENVESLATYGIEVKYINLNWFRRSFDDLFSSLNHPFLLKLLKIFYKHTKLEKMFMKQQIDLVYFVSPSFLSQHLEITNYIATIWDLCHRDNPEFPEVRIDRQFERREKNYNIFLPKATAIITDSEIGKNNCLRRYGLDEDRVYVIPFQAAYGLSECIRKESKTNITVKEQYKLDCEYVFYPAQLWAHKNHFYILEALDILKRKFGIKMGAIFSGGDQGNRQKLEKAIFDMGLQERIKFAGFVEKNELVNLYEQSISLVMPTYFGPTNIPPLEAFKFGVPVVYPDKTGLRDQVGDAALLVDLANPESLAVKLRHLVLEPSLRSEMAILGRKKLQELESFDRSKTLELIIKRFKSRCNTWK
ncbi:glycosyltransferase family 4 protein [Amylibacter sp.]|nr:glycosyltransferase family 4 protein [Amylibacter sp.]